MSFRRCVADDNAGPRPVADELLQLVIGKAIYALETARALRGSCRLLLNSENLHGHLLLLQLELRVLQGAPDALERRSVTVERLQYLIPSFRPVGPEAERKPCILPESQEEFCPQGLEYVSAADPANSNHNVLHCLIVRIEVPRCGSVHFEMRKYRGSPFFDNATQCDEVRSAYGCIPGNSVQRRFGFSRRFETV